MKFKLIALILSLILTVGCESTIHPELEEPERILVVDAWITQKMQRQEIKIFRSQRYFDNSSPVMIRGAAVSITDLASGEIYNFQEGSDSYYWNPTSKPFGTIGHSYQLTLIVDGERFEAVSQLRRVPPVEKIKFTYNEKDLVIKQDHYKAEFVASDPVGVGDTYWIKAFKNGSYLNKPTELNVVYDAGFTSGQSVDGTSFIIPVRKDFVNPLDKVAGKTNEFHPPYTIGDSLNVEIHSIDPQAFDFLFGLYFQISRTGGFTELFSMPLANVSSNIQVSNINSSTRVAGFFNVAAVSSSGLRLTSQVAEEAKRNR